mgnify:CR=1 FL=1
MSNIFFIGIHVLQRSAAAASERRPPMALAASTTLLYLLDASMRCFDSTYERMSSQEWRSHIMFPLTNMSPMRWYP